MESTLQNPVRGTVRTSQKATIIAYWIFTAIFCVQMSFTAYAQLRLPQVAQEFARLGFSAASFRIELSWAKLAGVAVLLLPMVPAWIKEWAYAGFAVTLLSALIAHFSLGEGVEAWGWAAASGAVWALSYLLWRRLQATPATA